MNTDKSEPQHRLTEKEISISTALLDRGLASPQAIEASKMECMITGETISTILVKNGFVSQANITDVLIHLEKELVAEDDIILQQIPTDLLIDNKILICAQTPTHVYICTLGSNEKAKYLLSKYLPQHEIIFVSSSIDKIHSYLEKLKMINDSDSSVLELVLRKAITQNASDIHIIPRRNSYSLFMRFLGVRDHIEEGRTEVYVTLAAKIKDRAKMDLAERRIPQDGGFAIEHNGRIIDLRVATVPGVFGETIVIRILDPEKAQFNLSTIGISAVSEWRKGISRSNGLCLICGPTGSGKTTTLNASTREMDRFGKAIYTAEDPVEYNIPFVSQVNINDSVGLTFPKILRSFLRADPDVIIVGEVRDTETAKISLKAAETGHMVFATLHTGSIFGAVQRLKDLDVDPHELKYVLRSILVQQLVRTVCPVCHGHEEQKKSCLNCFARGYAGRTIVSECHYFSGIEEVSELLNYSNIKWQTMLEDAYSKYMKGETDSDELIRVFGIEGQQMIDQRGSFQ